METSSNLIQLRDDDHFGLCPKCHRQGGNYHANRKDHWSVCKKHKLKWPTGSGLLSFPFTHDTGEFSWQAGEEVLKLNRFFLAGCQTVEPYVWPKPKKVVSVQSSGQTISPDGELLEA